MDWYVCMYVCVRASSNVNLNNENGGHNYLLRESGRTSRKRDALREVELRRRHQLDNNFASMLYVL